MAKRIFLIKKHKTKKQANRQTKPLLKQCCGQLREVENCCIAQVLGNGTKTSVWKCLRFVLEDDAEDF